MGERVNEKYEFGFEVVDEGIHVFTVQEPKAVTYDCKDKDGNMHGKGYAFSVKCVADGGPSDGLFHFENWRSRWPDGNLNTKAMSALYGFLIKLGVKKPGGLDTDEIENEKFQRGFESISGKPIGLEIFHSTGKDGKTWSRSKAYYTASEAREKMGNGKVGQKAVPVSAQKAAPAPAPAQDKDGW